MRNKAPVGPDGRPLDMGAVAQELWDATFGGSAGEVPAPPAAAAEPPAPAKEVYRQGLLFDQASCPVGISAYTVGA